MRATESIWILRSNLTRRVLPDDGWQFELVEGRLVRMPPSGLDASMLALRLGVL